MLGSSSPLAADQHEAGVRRRPQGTAALPPVPPRPLAPLSAQVAAAERMHPWSLAFACPHLEAQFAARYARTMWRTDLASVFLHAMFYGLLLFTPGPLGYMWWKLPLTTILRGTTYLAWLPILLIPQLRCWHLRYRDVSLCLMLAGMTAYMLCGTGVCNHQAWVDPAFATHPLFQGGFSWLGFSLILLQPRMRIHRFAAAAVAGAQLPALSNYCQDHFLGAYGRCMAIGAVKVSLVALLPLAGVYWLEARARKLFLDARRRADSGSPPPLERQPPSSLVHWLSGSPTASL
ncbi:hypothetical protein COHA_001479 [Chlorella ohadii]|uniref:Uncharacterized protein n=1 Tax=Chlorella ohadii TaxID=2649997 RepID=A0AAD5DVM8_9CHLO|nr:hypothetical protein COHA_001479 [Chlorella ohadii]